MKKHSGFTLIELMIVIAIIGVLAAVAIISYESFIAKAERNIDCVQTLPEMARDQEKYKQINRIYADTFTKLNTVARVGKTWSETPADITNTHTYTLTTANSDKTFLLTCKPVKINASGLDASDCGTLTYDNFGRKGGVGTSGSPAVFTAGGKPVEICWR